MKKYFRAASLLFYLLTLLVFFFVGLLYAKWIGAGKNQGLAAAAIVLGYGVLFAAIALCMAIFSARNLSIKMLRRLNLVFTIVLASLLFFLWVSRTRELQEKRGNIPKKVTTEAQR